MRVSTIASGFEFLAVTHRLEDGAPALRVVFGICLALVFFAGLYVFRKRRALFGRDATVVNDTWAARNLRLWEVILVWILAMEMLITVLFTL
jgi:hypothetical protein